MFRPIFCAKIFCYIIYFRIFANSFQEEYSYVVRLIFNIKSTKYNRNSPIYKRSSTTNLKKAMDNKGKKIGLALSGGGYRAAAYHIGSLRALHRLGILDKVDVISSVSGGSITAAYYALHKDNYEDFEEGFIKRLSKGVLWSSYIYLVVAVCLLFAMSVAMGHLIGFLTRVFFPNEFILTGIFATLGAVITFFILLVLFLKYSFVTLPTSNFISRLYNKVFFKEASLGDLPDSPVLCINSTNVATQLPFYFSKTTMGEYAYRVGGKSIFDATHFSIAKAVMASSCVPYGFTPITIDKKYLREEYDSCPNKPEAPKLIDGGVYDNQGAHKLSQNKSRFHTDFIIVSDAGNSAISAAGTTNIFNLAMQTINLMMERIKKMQRADNLYESYVGKEHCAYVPLEWDCSERLVQGFVDNLKNGNIHPDVWQAHAITEEEIGSLKGSQSTSANEAIVMKLKQAINWDTLAQQIPQKESEDLARSIGTNLTALSSKKIESLIKHSSWLAEVQIRLYMPMLVNH
ncbi:phospholipase, patatin family [Alloprevotella tannerae ATCC 51259]|uniref:Phospholipase, patatin family n=2 Tax=Alloprevotella tannerae TaxID=76122 RepID=C9LG27_9BACT|nr:phospholipase, patatin family [Alloprevotella tannerae ATCC 51259]